MNLKDFGVPGGKNKTLIILGAGASRGASFVKDITKVLPPLDIDFFQHIARMTPNKTTKDLIEFIREEYGTESGLSMEHFFSEADYTNRFHQELNIDKGPLIKKYEKALNNFYQALPKLLNITTSDACEYHSLLASLLHTRDSVISFNYDCLMDTALKNNANKRWDPGKKGYGFDINSGSHFWRDHSRGRPVQESLKLLKMHGSLNWKKNDDDSISLVEDPKEVKDLSKSIVPPTWFKDLTIAPYNDIWKEARKQVRRSQIMVIIGYSVPATDLFSKSLLKVEAGSKIKREKLKLLILVNPDEAARSRFINLIKDGLELSTTILEYNTFEELHKVLIRNGGS
jgi:hypothetical protein